MSNNWSSGSVMDGWGGSSVMDSWGGDNGSSGGILNNWSSSYSNISNVRLNRLMSIVGCSMNICTVFISRFSFWNYGSMSDGNRLCYFCVDGMGGKCAANES